MNESTLKTIFTAALSAVSISVFAVHYAPPADAPDQVVASFDRLLTHSSMPMAVADKIVSMAGLNPLRANVNTVLWTQPSYHLSVKNLSKSEKASQRD